MLRATVLSEKEFVWLQISPAPSKRTAWQASSQANQKYINLTLNASYLNDFLGDSRYVYEELSLSLRFFYRYVTCYFFFN